MNLYKFILSTCGVLFIFQSCLITDIAAQLSDKSGIIRINCSSKSLHFVLDEIRKQSGVNIIYNDKLIKNEFVTCRKEFNSVEAAIKNVLVGSDISYKKFVNLNTTSSYVLYKENKKIPKREYKALIVDQNTSNPDTLSFFINPQIISSFNLRYPYEAVKRNIEGKVVLKFLVNTDGEVSRTKINQSSGSPILDSATIDYANNLKFIPAQDNGKPKTVWMSMAFKYVISRE